MAFSACRAHYPGGSVWYVSIGIWRAPAPGCSQTAVAFPKRTAGRHPQLSFRGLLELHSRYGLRICSPTYSGLCHEAPIPAVTHRNGSSAIQAYRHLLEWDFHPLVICAIGARVRFAFFTFSRNSETNLTLTIVLGGIPARASFRFQYGRFVKGLRETMERSISA